MTRTNQSSPHGPSRKSSNFAGSAQAWAREQKAAIDKEWNAVDAHAVTVSELIVKYREARAESGRPVKSSSKGIVVRYEAHLQNMQRFTFY